MPDNLLPTLVQFPLLAVFVWFTVDMQKRYQASMDQHLTSEAAERTKRDEQWRAFLTEHRQAYLEALCHLDAEITALAQSVIRLAQDRPGKK